MTSPVLIRATSANRKLSPVVMDDAGGDRRRPRAVAPFVSSTFLPVANTCPPCPFKGNGCMAQSGYTGRPVRRLEAVATGMSATQVVLAEAREIRMRLHPGGVPQDGGRDGNAGRDLRLHVSGDVRTMTGLRALAKAVDAWKSRGGGSAWTFTHAWRSLPRREWGAISVLASCETPSDVESARAAGYAPAVTVPTFDGDRPFRFGRSTAIPCPAETRGQTCVECRLCLDRSDWVRDTGRAIAFQAHGPGRSAAKRALEVLNDEMEEAAE